MKKLAGFSTVEILFCVAMLGLLTAVAVPNFVRVQTQATVAQAKADMAALKLGLEAYKVDLGKYPWMNNIGCSIVPIGATVSGGMQPTLERLTTPVAYLSGTATFYDVFEGDRIYKGPTLAERHIADTPTEIDAYKQYFYTARNTRDTSTWGQVGAQDVDPLWYFLGSAGPDLGQDVTYQMLNAMAMDTNLSRAIVGTAIYDPTNGTVSKGSIWELGGQPQGYGTSMAYMINAANGSGVGDWEGY